MLMDPKKLSMLIREKKKKMMSAEPEVETSDPTADMNASDLMDLTQQARIEATLETPHKIDARDTAMMESDSDAMSIGLSEEEKTRMERLRKYMDSLDVW